MSSPPSPRLLALLNNALEASIAAELLSAAAAAALPFELRLAGADFADTAAGEGDGSGAAAAAAAAAEALLVHGHVRVDAALLARFPRLRCVSNHGVGVDHIDAAACSAARVRVYNTPDAVTGATADCAFALLLAAARRVVEGDAISRAPATVHFSGTWFGAEVHGQTLGVVGMGRIGSAVARRARGFDMRVLYHNRRRVAPEAEAALGAAEGLCRFCPELDELLGEADFVVVTAPATPETRHLIGAPQLARMRRSAFLVNVSRGSLVDQDALAAALGSGAIAGAALDVTEPEPLPRNHALLRSPNLTLTPHVGTATRKTRVTMAQLALANLAAGLGLPPPAGSPATAIAALNEAEVAAAEAARAR